MSYNLLNENVYRPVLSEILQGPYRVERIYYNQRYLFSNLFGPDSNFMNDDSTESEPVLFIVWTNYPENVPVGFIRLHTLGSYANTAPTIIVQDLFVLPEYRKNGAALRLVETAVRFAIERKSAFIQLETVQDNLSAKKLFESVGFKCQKPVSDLHVYSINFGRG
jgi:ribosomal protein S18 acetylase RimI-like enzyme